MEINLTKPLLLAIGWENMQQFGIDEDAWKSWYKFLPINLKNLNEDKLNKLKDLIDKNKRVRGAGVIVRDIATWISVITAGEFAKARTVKHFESLLTEFLRQAPGHRLYEKNDQMGEAWLCYYVNNVEYHPPQRGTYGTTPAYVEMEIVWNEMGGMDRARVHFHDSEVRGRTPVEALAEAGYFIETPERREQYMQEHETFSYLFEKVGMQMLATGTGTDDLDGNPKRNDSWYWRKTNTIALEKDGSPSRVVIDVFQEDDHDRRETKVHVDPWYWNNKPVDDDEDLEVPKVEIPIHPFLACFDLRRHIRMRIHVGYLKPYMYDRKLAKRLVLPPEVKSLVSMLLASDGGFQDIISGKSGGAIVMCAGAPGTGKTLTAEVYAESMERPLYSVQASQLGISSSELEEELLKTFARAQRWNAILLIDEADVYVRARGDDLQQNAIVGVFLRVLEYYNGVLFMTTNRLDLVDDAIASRCMARIEYTTPDKDKQAEIWRILSDTSGIKVSDETIQQVIEEFPKLTGRDVKNLLKLAHMISSSTGKPINFKMIKFVKRFKPTKDVGEDADD